MQARSVILGVSLIAAGGCATIEGHYDRAALQGPTAHVSGLWLCQGGGGSFLLWLQQSGENVSGTWTSLPSFENRPFRGSVKGRVLRADSGPVEIQSVRAGRRPWGFLIAFTISPEGTAADCVVNYYDIEGVSVLIRKSPMFRVDQRPAAGDDPDLAGGLVCRLPVASDGRVPATPDGSESPQDVFASLQYARDVQGKVIPSRILVPRQTPRKATAVHYPGAGLFGWILDRGALLNARRASPLQAPGESSFEGKPCWWVLNPGWHPGEGDPAPTRLFAEFYRAHPDSGAMPEDFVEVARRGSDGGWEPVQGGYLIFASTLTSARAVFEGGRPAGIETYSPEEPPLEDFLTAKETSIPIARWRTRAILSAKNRTLPNLLRNRKTSELAALVERIEQILLDLNHEAELARDRAQQAVESGEGGAEELREFSLVYKERIEVLKPVAAAIKEEVANRNR